MGLRATHPTSLAWLIFLQCRLPRRRRRRKGGYSKRGSTNLADHLSNVVHVPFFTLHALLNSSGFAGVYTFAILFV